MMALVPGTGSACAIQLQAIPERVGDKQRPPQNHDRSPRACGCGKIFMQVFVQNVKIV